MIIHQLFPQPVYTCKLERALTEKELWTINKYKNKTYKNEGNITSHDTYVLENKRFENLKKDLNKRVIDYFDKIICSSNSIIPYITQSWINYTEADQFHHRHSHTNSYVSGVFYINADKKIDSIKFYKALQDERITLNVAQYNLFNSPGWTFPVETGDIVLFPSTLVHGVVKRKRPTTRISLSFNVFVKGTLGDRRELAELIIQ